MVCSLIDECRCYSYEDDKKQFCGVRRGPDVLPCDEDCCFGGCPDDGSRVPFRIIKRPEKKGPIEKFDKVEISVFMLVLIVVLLGLLYIDLKIKFVR
jgi:hypothetical protein|tara:strand:- start:4438 stop:4728 length:291 start_codon:yes stop_codon:yes gene_type:complete